MQYHFVDMHDEEVILHNDLALAFVAPFVQFKKPILIKNCNLLNLDLYATYFLQGLSVVNCLVTCPVYWQSGGHNQKKITFANCSFEEFVDFEDCWFVEEIEFENVQFVKGTNLLGNKGTPVEVSFDKGYVLKNVVGPLALNTYK